MNGNNEESQKKERQLDELQNLVERHTRTERHLEQYSEIGSKENKDNAREKQVIREDEIQNLKKIIIGEKPTPEEQIENIVDKYTSTKQYVENFEYTIPDENLANIAKKQERREEQVEDLLNNILEDEGK